MKKHVLLVEDDHWLADSYKRTLEKEGFEVSSVSDASSAMRMVEDAAPDCIVADVMLEGHTIFALLYELQSYDDTRRIPVVLCSALDYDALKRNRLHQYGVVKVLDKATLTPDSLDLAVKECTT